MIDLCDTMIILTLTPVLTFLTTLLRHWIYFTYFLSHGKPSTSLILNNACSLQSIHVLTQKRSEKLFFSPREKLTKRKKDKSRTRNWTTYTHQKCSDLWLSRTENSLWDDLFKINFHGEHLKFMCKKMSFL